jgi:hypothetical protein
VATKPFAPGVLNFKWKHTLGGDLDVLNGFYMSYTGTAPSNAQLVALGAAQAAVWATDFGPLTDADTQLTSIEITDLSSSTSAQGTANVSETGSRSGNYLPASTCVLLNFTVARRYRGGKPKVFLPVGVQGDLNTAQSWQATFITSCVTAWNAIITATIAAPWTGGVIVGQSNVSYYSGSTVELYGTPQRARNVPTYRPAPLVNAISGVSGSSVVSTQRRRNRPGR